MDDQPKHWIGKIKADCCLRYSLLVFLFVINILSIVAIIIGLTYRGQCLIEQNISTYLIVSGFISTIYYIFLLIMMLMMIQLNSLDIANISKRRTHALLISIFIICLFMTAWLIAGCVWVFRIKSTVQTYEPNQSTYCPSTLYDYAFFYSIFLFIIYFIHYISFCCMTRTI